jgi:hypothetical protein
VNPAGAGSPRRDGDRADRLRAELLGPKRYATLSLDEVIEVGRILTGDPDGLSFYGLPPAEWYARGIRMLGRTCVEATPDVTAVPIAETVCYALGHRDGVGVVDPFAGSGNLMLHVAGALSASALGLEGDEKVWVRTRENLRILGAPAVVRLGDWLSYFDDPLPVEVTVYLLSPPWAGAFSFATGLDVTRTEPPIPSIVETISVRDRSAHRFAVVQHTPVEPVLNLSAVTDRHPVVGAGAGSVVVRVR